MTLNIGCLTQIQKEFDLSSMESIVIYEGCATHQLMKAFTELVEDKLENENEDESIRRQLNHVLVECMQNINHHGNPLIHENDDYIAGWGGLMVTRSPDIYRVITANLIESIYVDELTTILEEFNSLTEEQLYDLYKNKMITGKISSKGGAGVGLLDIRRKTANKLEYAFVKNDEKNHFFMLNVQITRK